jgi:hypothetical protein
MIVERLTMAHAKGLKLLFSSEKYMGVNSNTEYFVGNEIKFNELAYEVFCDTYLSSLNNFKAFGSVEDGVVTSLISFYEAIDSPAWYWTQIRSKDHSAIPAVLDAAIAHNEANGRLKFYSMFNAKYAKSYRRLSFSKNAQERYGFIDECIVPVKTKCIYQDYWQILFNRTLVPVESLVRCTYLKQEYRDTLPIAGNL